MSALGSTLREFTDLVIASPSRPPTRLADERGWSRFTLAGQPLPSRSQPVYFPLGDALVPAHLIELQLTTRGALEVLQYIVAADDALLMRRSPAHAPQRHRQRQL